MTTNQLPHLLHTADNLARQFNAHHASSFSSVQAVQSASTQLQNLLALPSVPVTRARPGGGIRERGMAKVQETIEEGLAGVRKDLARMEEDVEKLNQLLFQADLYLADPASTLHAQNPAEALTHVSSLYSSYLAELIRLRELLADFTTEAIGVDEWVEGWRVMTEVDKGNEEDLADLVGVMGGSWGGGDDVEMG